MREINTIKLFALVVLAQTALIGCEQDYGLKLTQKPLVQQPVDPQPVAVSPSSTPVSGGTPDSATGSPSEPVILRASDSFSPRALSAQVKMDILFVVDNSASMSDEQQILANNASAFISKFAARSVDYHIGLTTTDTYSYCNKSISDSSNPFNGYVNPFPNCNVLPGSLITRYSGYPFLTPSTPSIADKFAQNVKVGTNGSGNERGFLSALNTLSVAKLAAENAGFRRNDAFLATFVITDEDEQMCQGSADSVSVNNVFDHVECTPDQRIDRWKARVAELCGSACAGSATAMVIDMNAAAPAGGVTYPLGTSMNSYPNFYRKLSAKTGAQMLNIKSSTWGSELADVGAAMISQAESEFQLSHTPVVSSITVYIDSVLVPSSQYTYESAHNSIKLLSPALENAAGKQLKVNYQYR